MENGSTPLLFEFRPYELGGAFGGWEGGFPSKCAQTCFSGTEPETEKSNLEDWLPVEAVQLRLVPNLERQTLVAQPVCGFQ